MDDKYVQQEEIELTETEETEEIEEIEEIVNDKNYLALFKKRSIIIMVSVVIMILTSMFSKYHDFNIVLRSKALVFVLSFSLFAMAGSYLYVKSLNEVNKQAAKNILKRLSELSDILIVVPVFMLIVTLINVSSFSLSNVVGKSMEPNYYDQEDVVIMHTPFNKLERLDPVVVKIEENVFYIKRIIGLPGEFIVINRGVIYRADSEGEELTVIDETSLGDINYTFCTVNAGDYCEFTVPEDSYFVLGDNRTNSSDSRNARVGFIEEENIYGTVVFKYKNILRNRP